MLASRAKAKIILKIKLIEFKASDIGISR